MSCSPIWRAIGVGKVCGVDTIQRDICGLYTSDSHPDMGHYTMVCGFIMLLFIGFNRVWHFLYIQTDSIQCSIFHGETSVCNDILALCGLIGDKSGKSLLPMSALRERGVACMRNRIPAYPY